MEATESTISKQEAIGRSYDQRQKCAIPLLTTGLSASMGQKPYRTHGDCSPHRYVIDAGIEVVPHDRCPKCWEIWDYKLQNRTCPHCGLTMGAGCQLLLDTDECPWCEEGKITIAEPRCDACGFEVDREVVAWG